MQPSIDMLEPNSTMSWLPANITQICEMLPTDELPEFFLEASH